VEQRPVVTPAPTAAPSETAKGVSPSSQLLVAGGPGRFAVWLTAEQGPFGLPGPIWRLYQIAFGGALGAMLGWAGVSWAVHLGDRVLTFLTIGGGKGGSTGGGEGSPPIDKSWELLTLPLALWALLLLLLFVGLIWYTVLLIVSAPVRPDWSHHARFAKRLLPSPFVIVGVLWLTNYLQTWLIQTFYTPRVFVSYLASLAALLYQGIFFVACPDGIRQFGFVDPALVRSRPAVRYVLTLIGAAIVASMAWLTILLLPNSFVHRPDRWWRVFLP
jgi:hypothetical protein